MKDNLKIIGALLWVLLLVGLAIAWELARFHAFQEATGSDISYLKWKWLIEAPVNK